jgi:hypothetical protein
METPFGPDALRVDVDRAEQWRRCAGVVSPSRYVRDYVRRFGGIEAEQFSYPAFG